MILAPGWKCPACDAFTGDSKERHTKCRCCEEPRPFEDETREFILWMSTMLAPIDDSDPWSPRVIHRAVIEDLVEGVENGWRLTPRGHALAKMIDRQTA